MLKTLKTCNLLFNNLRIFVGYGKSFSVGRLSNLFCLLLNRQETPWML